MRVPRWLTNDRLGWGIVVFAAGVLVLVIIGRLRWMTRFPDALPEATLARLAREKVAEFIIEGEITYTDGVLMSRYEYDSLRHAYPVVENPADKTFPVYVFRAYGNIKQASLATLDSVPDYAYQAIEIALSGYTGGWTGSVSAYLQDSIVPDLHHLPASLNDPRPVVIPPTMAPFAPAKPKKPFRVTPVVPEITAEALP